jgi:hypothetical protein
MPRHTLTNTCRWSSDVRANTLVPSRVVPGAESQEHAQYGKPHVAQLHRRLWWRLRHQILMYDPKWATTSSSRPITGDLMFNLT